MKMKRLHQSMLSFGKGKDEETKRKAKGEGGGYKKEEQVLPTEPG